jgi:hypothetical protein
MVMTLNLQALIKDTEFFYDLSRKMAGRWNELVSFLPKNMGKW